MTAPTNHSTRNMDKNSLQPLFHGRIQLSKTYKKPLPRSTGFTLIEVMVALAIVAIALMAGIQASASLTRNAQRQSDSLLAQLCAQNALAQVRLMQQLPSIGDELQTCQQAGRSLQVRLNTSPTPNPQFRRVDAQVLDADQPLLRLSTIVGRY